MHCASQMHSGEGERSCFHGRRLTDTRCEGVLQILSPTSTFIAFLLRRSCILECECQLSSNYLFPFVSTNSKSRNYIFVYLGLCRPTPSYLSNPPSPQPDSPCLGPNPSKSWLASLPMSFLKQNECSHNSACKSKWTVLSPILRMVLKSF